MAGNPSTYMEATHLVQSKQIKVIHTTCSAKKLHENYRFSKQAYQYIVLLQSVGLKKKKVKSHLYTHRISSNQNCLLASS